MVGRGGGWADVDGLDDAKYGEMMGSVDGRVRKDFPSLSRSRLTAGD
jgi:hypothetical protein